MAPAHSLAQDPKTPPSQPLRKTARKDSHPCIAKTDCEKSPALSPTSQRLVPVVRVVEIFAPKVIQTDVANFRSLVQRLTGKSCLTDQSLVLQKRKGKHAKRKAALENKTATFPNVRTNPSDLQGHHVDNQHFRAPVELLPGNVQKFPVMEEISCLQELFSEEIFEQPEAQIFANETFCVNSGVFNDGNFRTQISDVDVLPSWDGFNCNSSGFSELDIMNGVCSSAPLPELIHLPPLVTACQELNDWMPPQRHYWRLAISSPYSNCSSSSF